MAETTTVLGITKYKLTPMSSDEAKKSGRFDGRKGMLPRKDQEGYFVEYEDGYTSWCPKATMDSKIIPITGKSGIATLRDGQKFYGMLKARKVATGPFSHKTCQAFLNMLLGFIAPQEG